MQGERNTRRNIVKNITVGKKRKKEKKKGVPIVAQGKQT